MNTKPVELPDDLIAKVKKLVKANVQYLVQDPDDPRIAIQAQDQMEGFIFNWMREELTDAIEKAKQEERERVCFLIEEKTIGLPDPNNGYWDVVDSLELLEAIEPQNKESEDK